MASGRILGVFLVFVGAFQCICADAEKRQSADVTSLQHTVDQLTWKLNSLEAAHIALHAEVNELEAKVASTRCESGKVGFSPNQARVNTTLPNGEIVMQNSLHVSFIPPFYEDPVAIAGITHIDGDNRHIVKIDVDMRNLDTTGFDITVSERVDASNFGLTVMWMACSR